MLLLSTAFSEHLCCSIAHSVTVWSRFRKEEKLFPLSLERILSHKMCAVHSALVTVAALARGDNFHCRTLLNQTTRTYSLKRWCERKNPLFHTRRLTVVPKWLCSARLPSSVLWNLEAVPQRKKFSLFAYLLPVLESCFFSSYLVKTDSHVAILPCVRWWLTRASSGKIAWYESASHQLWFVRLCEKLLARCDLEFSS